MMNFHREGQREILKKYPNLYNNELTAFAGCAVPENRRNATEAFERCCPHILQIQGLRHKTTTQKPVCQWEVNYQLKKNEQTSQGTVSEEFLKDLVLYHPMDCVIITRESSLPNIDLTIIYGVKCNCLPLDFEFVMARPQKSMSSVSLAGKSSINGLGNKNK